MYLDVLLLILSLLMIDMCDFSFALYSGVCLRIIILIIVFGILFITEKSLNRYLRKHRGE